MEILIVLVLLAPIALGYFMWNMGDATREAEALEAQGKSSCAVSVFVLLISLMTCLFAAVLGLAGKATLP